MLIGAYYLLKPNISGRCNKGSSVKIPSGLLSSVQLMHKVVQKCFA